ncbi:hypothetical protein SLEP1_g19002 [Rubroshorea leprosula]|nr:hypothetical protein SLEP1_g19002 [Rubroshorea leprosula]
MAEPYLINGVQPCRDSWYTFQDDFLKFNAWSAKRALKKQKDLVLLEAFKGNDSNTTWFPSPRDAKEMLAENGFVEILRATGILKSVALSQTLQINGNVECLYRLVRRWCTSTHTFILAFGEVIVTLEDVANLMLLPIVGEEDPWHIALMREECHVSSFEEGKDSPYVCAAFLTTWLSKFVFGGFPNHKIMAECIPLAIRLAEGVKLSLAPLMLGTLYHRLDVLHFDEILGASYYIIESHVCLSLLQMFAWERFRPYHSSYVTSGKALKEYPMVKCGYTSGIALLACSWIGKMKIKVQIISEVDGFLDDRVSFNFHAYKTMPGTFAPFEVSLFDRTLPVILENQIMEFTMGNSSHLEMLAVITPSMLPCITWRGTEGAATLKFLSVARMSIMSPLMLEYWDALLKKFAAFIQSLQEVVEYGSTSRDCERLFTHNYDQAGVVGEEFGQQVAGGIGVVEGAEEAAPPKRSVLGKRKSVAHPPKSRARRTSSSLASKPNKAKVSTPSKAKIARDKDTSCDSGSNESSWGDPDPEVIEWIKRLRPVHGERRLAESTEAKASEVPPHKPTTPRPISELPPFRAGDFELVPKGFIPARKTSATSSEKVMLSFTLLSVEKGEVKAAIGVSKEKGKKVTEVISSNPSESSSCKSSRNDASFKNGNGSKQRGKVVGFQGSIYMNRATLEEFKSDAGDATKKFVSNKGKMDIGVLTMSSTKKMVSLGETEHGDQQSAAPAKLGEIDDLVMRLLNSLDEMNEDRDVSLARFGLVPLGGSRAVDSFAVLTLLELDALDDAESINFEVNTLCTHLSNLAKVYVGRIEFGMVKGLDGRIREQAKHVAKMEKSLVETKELVVKLEKGLVSTKAYLGSLNQEKEHLDSNSVIELCQACMEAAKAFRDEPSPFLP